MQPWRVDFERTCTNNVRNAIDVAYDLSSGAGDVTTFVPAAIWGAVPGTADDMSAEIQLALNSCPLGATLYFGPGTYNVSTNLVCARAINIYAYKAVWDWGTSWNSKTSTSFPTLPTALDSGPAGDAAFTFGYAPASGQTLSVDLRVAGLKLTRSAATQAPSSYKGAGFRFLSTYQCHFEDLDVSGFSVGYWCSGSVNGTYERGFAYNRLCNLNASSVAFGIYLDPGMADGVNSGWCNENSFFGGRIALTPTAQADANGCCSVYIRFQATDTHECNNNVFEHISLEGQAGSGTYSGHKIYCEGRYNTFAWCRYEDPSGRAYPHVGVTTTFTAVAATNIITTAVAAMYDSYQITVSSTGVLPGGLKEGVTYYASASAGNALSGKIFNPATGAEVDITDAGTGTHTISVSPADITFVNKGGGGGTNNILLYGFDVYKQNVVGKDVGMYNHIYSQTGMSFDRNHSMTGRSFAFGNTAAALYSQSSIVGNGVSPGLWLANTTGSFHRALVVKAANEKDWRLSLTESTDGVDHVGGLVAYTSHNFTADHTTDTFTISSHGMATGARCALRNTGGALPTTTSPTTLLENTWYYIISTGTNTFKLAATEADALGATAITIDGNGTGTHRLDVERNWVGIRNGSPYHWTMYRGLVLNNEDSTRGSFTWYNGAGTLTAGLKLNPNTARVEVGSPSAVSTDPVLVTTGITVSGPINVGVSSLGTSTSASATTTYVGLTAGALTITLPAVASVTDGHVLIIKDESGAGGHTIDGNAAETIDGAATKPLGASGSMTLVKRNSAWWIT